MSSRDFIGTELGRAFRQSPNRDRIARTSLAITHRYSFQGVFGNDTAPPPGSILFPPFVLPEFRTGTSLPYNQNVGPTPGNSLPFPAEVGSFLTSTNFTVGQFVRVTFLVTGLFESYPITVATPLESGTTTFTDGFGNPASMDYEYYNRPPAFMLRLGTAAFPAQPDAWIDPRGDTSPLGTRFQPWRFDEPSNYLVANIGAAGAGTIKTVTATVRITQPGPFAVTAFIMGITLCRGLRQLPAGSWTFNTHRRNIENVNPPNPLVSGYNSIPANETRGTQGFPSNYFGGAFPPLFNQSDCQWCWAKVASAEFASSHMTPTYSG